MQIYFMLKKEKKETYLQRDIRSKFMSYISLEIWERVGKQGFRNQQQN